MADTKKVQVKLVKSFIARPPKQELIANALGLRRIGDVAVHADTPQIRGMIDKISHLLEVTEA
ncbi:MAG: 50S ribosomal protein L30 [Firmicutes bacterium]|nr:50S ribosomal protein L30 [Bacillota bacterium]